MCCYCDMLGSKKMPLWFRNYTQGKKLVVLCVFHCSIPGGARICSPHPTRTLIESKKALCVSFKVSPQRLFCDKAPARAKSWKRLVASASRRQKIISVVKARSAKSCNYRKQLTASAAKWGGIIWWSTIALADKKLPEWLKIPLIPSPKVLHLK